jgi:hypothetical protein
MIIYNEHLSTGLPDEYVHLAAGDVLVLQREKETAHAYIVVAAGSNDPCGTYAILDPLTARLIGPGGRVFSTPIMTADLTTHLLAMGYKFIQYISRLNGVLITINISGEVRA